MTSDQLLAQGAILFVQQVYKGIEQKNQQVERDHQISQELFPISEILLQMVVFGFENVVGLNFTPPTCPAIPNNRDDITVMQLLGRLSPRRYSIGINQTPVSLPFKMCGATWEPNLVVLFEPGHELDVLTPNNATYHAITIPEDHINQKVRPLLATELQSQLAGWQLTTPSTASLYKLSSVIVNIHQLVIQGLLG